MSRLRFFVLAAELSLFYNVNLLFAVSMNYEWAKTRAAGGQFDSFPIGIRILYFLMAVIMGALMFWVWDKRNGTISQRERSFSNFLAITFMISTVMQLISRSSDERWNAIPAAILALIFWRLPKSKP